MIQEGVGVLFDPATLARLEKKKRRVTLDEACWLAVVLDIPLMALMWPIDETEPVMVAPGRRAADQVGIAPGDGFHELRHPYASLLISSGCSVTVVQRRLGHASAQETLDTYSHLWPDDDQRTTEVVDSQLGPALLLSPGATAAVGNV